MFEKQFKVKGDIINGQIISNWSKESPCAIQISTFNTLTLDAEGLTRAINDLTKIRDLVLKENAARKEGKE